MFPWRRDRRTGSEDSTSADTSADKRSAGVSADSTGAGAARAEPGKNSFRKKSPKPGAESYGFTGLEGDFEAERRRAAEATHEPAEPYEGEDGRHPLPGTAGGLTHP
ncbi:hypothetical protein SAMN05216282_10116 [Cryobacterium psychrotolerans]|uniref:Uncharacterized protein n=1 Tax=Cryobacterium psychrotolerans TaxID=386301 RepID=A0A1G8WXQ1_9MICO|nr:MULTISPECIES: hypothetical protein [Cryobacterium]TFD49046.1 hypothetical protein E3T33_00760 [Cryobacterium sp. TMT1-2-1]TFD85060.1 hypothetical protein E3T56_08835 [Cryobacterium psychrotolerans]SDJ82994.1 hypothetical protein SAMN05216282_10116 [Cryobacterium psychrotolerans]